jgi:hypothetical protein
VRMRASDLLSLYESSSGRQAWTYDGILSHRSLNDSTSLRLKTASHQIHQFVYIVALRLGAGVVWNLGMFWWLVKHATTLTLARLRAD